MEADEIAKRRRQRMIRIAVTAAAFERALRCRWSVRSMALTGHEAEAREALEHYLAMPSSAQFRTIGALKAYFAPSPNVNTDPRADETLERQYEGLRKAGMPEE